MIWVLTWENKKAESHGIEIYLFDNNVLDRSRIHNHYLEILRNGNYLVRDANRYIFMASFGLYIYLDYKNYWKSINIKYMYTKKEPRWKRKIYYDGFGRLKGIEFKLRENRKRFH